MSTTSKSTMEFSGDADKLTQAIRQIVDTNKQLIQSIDQLSRKSQDANDRAIEAARKRDEEAQKRKTQLDEEKRLKEELKKLDEAWGQAKDAIAAKDKAKYEQLTRLERQFNEHVNTQRKLQAADEKNANDKAIEGRRLRANIIKHVIANEAEEEKKANDKVIAGQKDVQEFFKAVSKERSNIHAKQKREVEELLGAEIAASKQKEAVNKDRINRLNALIKSSEEIQRQEQKVTAEHQKQLTTLALSGLAAIAVASKQLLDTDKERAEVNRDLLIAYDKQAKSAMVQSMLSRPEFNEMFQKQLFPIMQEYKLDDATVIQQFREAVNAGVDPKNAPGIVREIVAMQKGLGAEHEPVGFAKGIMQMMTAMKGGGENVEAEDIKKVATTFAGLFQKKPLQPMDIAELSKLTGVATELKIPMEEVFATFAVLRGAGGKAPEEAQVLIRNLMSASLGVRDKGPIVDKIKEYARQTGKNPEDVFNVFDISKKGLPAMLLGIANFLQTMDEPSRVRFLGAVTEDRQLPGMMTLTSEKGIGILRSAIENMRPAYGESVMRKNIASTTTGPDAQMQFMKNEEKLAQLRNAEKDWRRAAWLQARRTQAEQDDSSIDRFLLDWLGYPASVIGTSKIAEWIYPGVKTAVDDRINKFSGGKKAATWKPPAQVDVPKQIGNFVRNPNPVSIDFDRAAKEEKAFQLMMAELDAKILTLQTKEDHVRFQMETNQHEFRKKFGINAKMPAEMKAENERLDAIADELRHQTRLFEVMKKKESLQRQAHEATAP